MAYRPKVRYNILRGRITILNGIPTHKFGRVELSPRYHPRPNGHSDFHPERKVARGLDNRSCASSSCIIIEIIVYVRIYESRYIIIISVRFRDIILSFCYATIHTICVCVLPHRCNNIIVGVYDNNIIYLMDVHHVRINWRFLKVKAVFTRRFLRRPAANKR